MKYLLVGLLAAGCALAQQPSCAGSRDLPHWLSASGAQAVPVVGQHGRQIFQLQASEFGIHHHPLQIVLEQMAALSRVPGRRRRHYCSDPGLHFEQAFGGETGDDLVRRVGVDLERGAERFAGKGTSRSLERSIARRRRKGLWQHAQAGNGVQASRAVSARLRETGSPQTDAPYRPTTQRIGNLPDLRALFGATPPTA